MNLEKRNNIKLALIGCGNWGKNIARNLSEMNALSCIYDPQSNIAKKISNDLKLPNYSLKEIFFESFNKLKFTPFFNITAAEITGPAKQPLPTSSTPAVIIFLFN